MKINKTSVPVVILLALGISSCQSASITSVSETSVEETSEMVMVENLTTDNSSETILAEESSDITESEISETEFVTSLPNMRYIEYDGSTLPDGVYYIGNCIYDEDRLGVTCNVCGFPYLLEEDVNLLNDGDTIKYNDFEYTVTKVDLENVNHPIYLLDDCYSLEHQFNDQYYIEDGCDYRVLGDIIVESYHFDISADVGIWQGYIFGISKEQHDSWYLKKDYSDQLQRWGIEAEQNLFFFKNIDALVSAWDQECEYEKYYCEKDDIEYVARLYGYYPGGLIVVEDQTITEMYINPWQHQPLFLYTYRWNSEINE